MLTAPNREQAFETALKASLLEAGVHPDNVELSYQADLQDHEALISQVGLSDDQMEAIAETCWGLIFVAFSNPIEQARFSRIEGDVEAEIVAGTRLKNPAGALRPSVDPAADREAQVARLNAWVDAAEPRLRLAPDGALTVQWPAELNLGLVQRIFSAFMAAQLAEPLVSHSKSG